MKCKAVLKEIEEMEAHASVSGEAYAHLLVCATCCAFADERTMLRQLVGSLESVTAPPDFDWRLRARLAEARSEREHRRLWHRGFAPGAQAITLAASFALLVVAVVVYRQIKPVATAGTESPATAAGSEKAGVKATDTPSSNVNPQDSTQAGRADPVLESKSNDTPRTRVVKNIKAGGTRIESASAAQSQRIFSNDFGSRAAQEEEFTPAGVQNSSAEYGSVISVAVRSPQSTRLRFEDGQGTKRTLAPIIFGGQALNERTDATRLVPASEKGIW